MIFPQHEITQWTQFITWLITHPDGAAYVQWTEDKTQQMIEQYRNTHEQE